MYNILRNLAQSGFLFRKNTKIGQKKEFLNREYFFLYFAMIFFLCPFLSQCTWSRNSRHPRSSKTSDGPLPKYHIIKKGETLWGISKRYNVPLDEIIRYNNIDDVKDIPAGKKIYIPGPTDRNFSKDPVFIWPLKGEIRRGFKNAGPIHHSGIDILALKGTPILAAASGEVIYNGDQMAGYGNMIIIKHNNNFSSVYAHNRVNLVKVGDRIKKGKIIAKVGSTGRSTQPHLHFEIRRYKKPVDPMLYLPKL